MNVRLIDVVSDLIYSEHTQETPIDNLVLSYGSSVSLKSNFESISYKKSPLSTPVLGGNEGCMCIYYVNPQIITENIAREITDLGLVIDKESDVVIEISSQSDSFLTDLTIDIKKNGISVASNELRIRNRYHGDLGLDAEPRSDEGSIIHHLTKNTFWNFILNQTGRIKQNDNLVTTFLNRYIKVESSKKEETLIAAKLTEMPSHSPQHEIELGKSGDFVGCNSQRVSRDSQISSGLHILDEDLVIPIEHTLRDIEKIVCLDKRIYIVTTPKYRKEFILINEFDYKGNNISNTKYSLPALELKGYPRKALIYFQVESGRTVIGIQEFGKNIDPENAYYILPQEMPENSSKKDGENAGSS